jgi:hypothetical protein
MVSVLSNWFCGYSQAKVSVVNVKDYALFELNLSHESFDQ